MRFTRVVIVLCISTTLGTAVTAKTPSDAIRFSLEANGAIIIPVIVGGAGPFPFLLDTGSTHSAVGASLVSQLGAPIIAETSMASSAGALMLPVARIPRVRVGPAAVDELLPTVMPDRVLDGEHARGIIGQDFLSALNYTLDYRHHLLIWNGPSAPAPGLVPMKLEWAQGRFLVQLPQAGDDGRLLRLVPDTGSASVVLFARPGASHVDVRPSQRRLRLTTVTGERDVDCALMRTLRIGVILWRDEPVVVVDRLDGSEGDGLLPLHRFSRVSFNTQGRYMTIE